MPKVKFMTKVGIWITSRGQNASNSNSQWLINPQQPWITRNQVLSRGLPRQLLLQNQWSWSRRLLRNMLILKPWANPISLFYMKTTKEGTSSMSHNTQWLTKGKPSTLLRMHQFSASMNNSKKQTSNSARPKAKLNTRKPSRCIYRKTRRSNYTICSCESNQQNQNIILLS